MQTGATDAIRQLEAAVRLRPAVTGSRNATVLDALGVAYFAAEPMGEAVSTSRAALNLAMATGPRSSTLKFGTGGAAQAAGALSALSRLLAPQFEVAY